MQCLPTTESRMNKPKVHGARAPFIASREIGSGFLPRHDYFRPFICIVVLAIFDIDFTGRYWQ